MAKSKYGKVGTSEVLSNKWGRDVAAARRSAEAVVTGREQLDVQEQLLTYEKSAFDQRNTIIAQNNRLIEIGERTNTLLEYLADRVFEESQGRGADSPVD